MGLQFTKASRLKRASEFSRLKQEGTPFHGKHLILSVLKGMPAAEKRVGIVTSRRVGGAVVRNLTRRRLREIVRHALPRVEPGTWMVIIARPYAARASFEELREEW